MRTTLLISAIAALCVGGTTSLAANRGQSPVIVELYTSQGCSGCLEASAFASELFERPRVLLLSFGVDYWDYLGWRDTFAEPEFVARQRAYTSRLDNRHPYTPQMVVDGHVNSAGFSRDFVNIAINFCFTHLTASPPMSIARSDGGLSIEIGDGEEPDGEADVWLVSYEPGRHDVPVEHGENAGSVMAHYNVVHGISRIGGWRGEAVSLSAPASDDLAYAVLVQRPELGAMIAVDVAPPPES